MPAADHDRPAYAGGRRARGSDPARDGEAHRSDRGRCGGHRSALAGASVARGIGSGRVSDGISKRRLFGIDRSGPPPDATLSGHPLHPWTIPNIIGYLRLAGIPVFLIVALSSGDGHSALAAALFAVIGWADYLDGFAARLTGQYSRLGALLDPIVDRLLVVSGMVICWRFELLPRWAIALVVARELLVLALSRYGLRHGLELKLNW